MANIVSEGVEISGVDELYKTFRQLPAKTQNKAMKPAMREGAKIVKKAAAGNIRAITSESSRSLGLLAKSLAVYQMKARGFIRMAVSVRKGKVTDKGVRVGLYASVLEYGKENQPPRSWIRKAARESTNAVIQKVALEAEKRMNAAIEASKK